MQPLNFPNYSFRFKSKENKTLIFDSLRKKFVHLTPEEWVRQHTVQFLLQQKKYPQNYINVEKSFQIAGLTKRYDLVVYKSDQSIWLLVECKAPEVTITQEVFDQTARYNQHLQADFLMLTNGVNHYFCQIDYQQQQYHFLQDLPDYPTP